MDLKTILQLQSIRGDNTYVFNIPAGASYGEAYDAVHECLGKLLAMMEDATKKSAPKKEKKEVEEKK